MQAGLPMVVGSIGNAEILAQTTPEEAANACDVIEIRIDLLSRETLAEKPWQKFENLPLLFTARCESEGGAAGLGIEERISRIREVMDDASLIDIELSSATSMAALVEDIQNAGIPWIASFHDFHGVPAIAELTSRHKAAKKAGAAVFKAAVTLGWHTEAMGPLALFLKKSADFPISLMGMGPLAPVSRVLFAQMGSVLNYGYLGNAPTAPGQWSARQLKEAIDSVVCSVD